MPSSANYVRDYKQENKTAKKRKETGAGAASGDVKRHKARAKFIKKNGAAAAKGRDIGHKKSIKSGGGNGSGNLRAVAFVFVTGGCLTPAESRWLRRPLARYALPN